MDLEFPIVLQQNMECGAACLCIIALYYGREIPLPYMQELCETNSNGASLYALEKAAKKMGFHGLSVKINFEKLEHEAPLPVIAYLKFGHFAVVYKIDKDHIYVSDPSFGLCYYTRDEFLIAWNGLGAATDAEEGIALLLEPALNELLLCSPQLPLFNKNLKQ